ncbi:MAG: GntR family transcriptional regulator [Opitutaceae bacterium]|nr:GntR family transcriptional regulator [Opitutaceae bacterium]
MAGSPSYRTKTELVYETLRERIVTLQLPPGSRVKIDELARSLGVSSIPVREAVARLAAERFVTVTPHTGQNIAPINRDMIQDVFAVMNGIERAAAAQVLANLTPSDIEEVNAMRSRIEAIDPQQHVEEWCAANVDFHLRIVKVARLGLAEDFLRLAFSHWQRIRLFYQRDLGVSQRARLEVEHRKITTALKNRDLAALDSVVSDHNQHALKLYLQAAAERQ